jgi:hypothetical protein
MNRRWISLAVLWLGLVVIVAYEATVVATQSRALRSLQQRLTDQERQLGELRRRSEAVVRELGEARQQLTAIPATTLFRDATTAEQQADVSAWLGRVKRLRALFDERPEQRIPELRLLTDVGWLRTARRFPLDSEDNIRQAMADIRAAAMRVFVGQVQAAERAYVNKENTDRMPSSLAELAPYFDPPADPDILARYEIVKRNAPPPPPNHNGLVSARPGPWIVQNAVATDPDYETRFGVGSNSRSEGTGPFTWEPNFRERYTAAAKSYAQEHQGTSPSSPVDAISYFNPPLEAAVAERLIKTTKQNP